MTIALGRYQPVQVGDLIRMGRHNDGGYVVSRQCLDRTQVLLTFGIGGDWSFERDFAELRPDVELLSLDASIDYADVDASTAVFVRQVLGQGLLGRFGRVQRIRRRFRMIRDFQSFYSAPNRRFLRLHLGNRNDAANTSLDRLIDQHLGSLASIRELGLFVKMDIEGDEYRTITSLARYTTHVNGLVVEFHNLDSLWREFVEVTEVLFDAFAICHIHGNNFGGLIPGTQVPRIVEITMVNKQLLPPHCTLSNREYPIPDLDEPNDPSQPDLHLTWSA